MLALLEICVRDAGGSYAFCDTDSMAIVASRSGGSTSMPGGRVKALTWNEANKIVKRFTSLNPYDRKIIKGSILNVEDVNYENDDPTERQRELFAYVVAAKRYALFTKEKGRDFTIRDGKESGLGHLLNPTNADDESTKWIDDVWRAQVGEALGMEQVRPKWVSLPALSRISVSSPDRLRPMLRTKQVRPFNFLLSAQVASLLGHPEGVNPKKFHLIAPYESDSRKWLKLHWTDMHSGKRFSVTTRMNVDPKVARVKSYREVIEEHARHPEPKSLGSDGLPCSRSTRGLLTRRPVTVRSISYVGKESNRLEDVTEEVVHDLDEVLEIFIDPGADEFQTLVVPVLGDIPAKILAKKARVTVRQIRRLITANPNARQKPSAKTRVRLTKAAAQFARTKLEGDVPEDDLSACIVYTRWKATSEKPQNSAHM